MDLTFEKHIVISMFLTAVWIVVHNFIFPFDATPLAAIGVGILAYAFVTSVADEIDKIEETLDN